MSHDLEDCVEYRHTMDALESCRHTSSGGSEYWLAKEVQPVLGYKEWRNFEGVVERAWESMKASGTDPSHHIVGTNKMVLVGSGASREVADIFLSRAACYLIAMNGDPKKPEIAAAQTYFAVQTRLREVETGNARDEKRLEEREKVKASFKVASSAAQHAGVTGPKQALFHNARYQGLYKQNASEYKAAKGIPDKENPFDRMGVLELSANDFQMNLAAETLKKERVQGVDAAIRTNKKVAERVRDTMLESGVVPEHLPIEEPIKNVQKRVKSEHRKLTGSSSTS